MPVYTLKLQVPEHCELTERPLRSRRDSGHVSTANVYATGTNLSGTSEASHGGSGSVHSGCQWQCQCAEWAGPGGGDLLPVSSIMILIYKSKSSGMYSPGHLVRYRKIRILDE
jgi:hypothetical protein